MGFVTAIDAEKTGRRALRMGNTHTTPNFFGETLNTTRNRMKHLIVQNDRYFLGGGKPRLYCDHWARLWLQWHVRRLWEFRIAFSFDCSSNGGCQLQCWRIGSGGNMMMWQWQPRQMYNLWHAMHLAAVEKVVGLHGDSDAHEDRFIRERTVLLTDSDITKLRVLICFIDHQFAKDGHWSVMQNFLDNQDDYMIQQMVRSQVFSSD